MKAGGSSIAAGAQAGAAFGPWGAAIGGAIGGATDVMKEAMGGPNTSGGGFNDARSAMDGSGWVISTGGSKAKGGPRYGGGIEQGGSTNAPQAAGGRPPPSGAFGFPTDPGPGGEMDMGLLIPAALIFGVVWFATGK